MCLLEGQDKHSPSNNSKHNCESSSDHLGPAALPQVQNCRPAQLGSHTTKTFSGLAFKEIKLPVAVFKDFGGGGVVLFSCSHLELFFSLCLRVIRSGGMWTLLNPCPHLLVKCGMCGLLNKIIGCLNKLIGVIRDDFVGEKVA